MSSASRRLKKEKNIASSSGDLKGELGSKEAGSVKDGSGETLTAKGASKRKAMERNEMTSRYKQRALVLDEIVVTEDHYVTDLEVCVRSYLKPLRESEIVPRQVLFDIFSNMELLAALNKDMLKQMDARRDSSESGSVADVFVEFAEQLVGAYSVYCNQHFKALDVLRDRMEKNERLSQFLENQRSTVDELEGLRLSDYLIKPVQRICKYPLLLRELVKHTSEDADEFEKLRDAHAALDKVTGVINARKAEAENEERMRAIAQSITGTPSPLVTPGRSFVRQGLLQKFNKQMKGQPRMFFLFSDWLIYCAEKGGGQKYQYKGDIPLEASAVSTIPGDAVLGKDVPNGLQIMRADTKRVYPLSAKSVSERDAWIKAIDDVISKRLADVRASDAPMTPIEAPDDILAAGLARSKRKSTEALHRIEPASRKSTEVSSLADSSSSVVSVASSCPPSAPTTDSMDSMIAPASQDASLAHSIAGLEEKAALAQSARKRMLNVQNQLVEDLEREQARTRQLEELVASMQIQLAEQARRIRALEDAAAPKSSTPKAVKKKPGASRRVKSVNAKTTVSKRKDKTDKETEKDDKEKEDDMKEEKEGKEDIVDDDDDDDDVVILDVITPVPNLGGQGDNDEMPSVPKLPSSEDSE